MTTFGLCYICDEYPAVARVFGGMGVAYREQAEAFARRGHRVQVVCRTSDSPAGVHEVNGVRVHVLTPSGIPKLRGLVDRLRVAALVRRVCRPGSDVVVAPEYAGPVLLKLSAAPLVVRLGGAMCMPTPGHSQRPSAVARLFERRTVNLADATYAVSRFSAETIVSALGARPRPVAVFPNAVDPAVFHPADGAADPNRVLFVGKMAELKGIFVLADAMARVFARVPGATLTLVGADLVEHGRSGLEAFRDRLGPHEERRVRWLGRLPHGEVARELRECAVMVLPSLTDMCPVALLEAMSSGRPVVASNRGGIPELVEDGRTGLLADPARPDTFADALVRVLTDTAFAASMGRAAREAVLASHTPEALVDRLAEFYSSLVEPRPESCVASPAW